MTSLTELDTTTAPAQKGLTVEAVQGAMVADGLGHVLNTDGQLDQVATTTVDGRCVRSVHAADSQAAGDAVMAAIVKAHGKPASPTLLEAVKASNRHQARQAGQAVPVHLRVAQTEAGIYASLRPGYVAHIRPGAWAVVDDAAEGVPLFRRGSGSGDQPTPERFDSPGQAFTFVFRVLTERFGLPKATAVAVIGLVLEWHRTSTPHPILELVGAAGSGKSTLADWLLSLIDPVADGRRVTVGTAVPDIAAAAQQRYVLMIDNAGKFDKATSDTACVISTGGTLVVRLYFTNGETAPLHMHRPLIVTAVTPTCVAPDLQSRTVRIEMRQRQGGMVSEAELRSELEALRPKMLGAIYTLLAAALNELPAVKARGGWSHRLVDFDQMGEATLASVGGTPGQFTAAVNQLRSKAARRTASGDLFVMALVGVLRKLSEKVTHDAQPTLNAVVTSPQQMAVVAYGDAGEHVEVTIRPKALHQLLPRGGAGYGRDDPIPATERGLTDALRRVQPLLKDMGITVTELHLGSRGLVRFDFDRGAISDV